MKAQKLNKAIIFGAGQAGEAAFQYVIDRQQQVVAFVDNDSTKTGLQLCGVPVYHAADLSQLNFDLIYIASEYFEQIERQLVEELSVAKEKIKRLPAAAIKHLTLGQDQHTTDLADAILILICNALTEQGVRYYVDAGTLLGIIRDQQLIPWDDDLDIAVESTESEACYQAVSSVLPKLKALTGTDYKLNRYYTEQDFGAIKAGELRSFKLAPMIPSKILPLMDVFIKYKQGENMDYVIASRGFRMPASHIDKLEIYLYKGHKINIPSEVELYLERHYGDWRTPVKEWDLSMLKNTTVFRLNQ